MHKTIVYVVALVLVSLVGGTLLGVVLSRRQGPHEYNQKFDRFIQREQSGREEGSHRFAQREEAKREGGPIDKLVQILKLNTDQEEKITEILKQAREEAKQVQSKTKETFMEIKKKTDAKIKKILTPEQQAKFDELESNLRKRMQGKDRPRFLDRNSGGNRPMPEGESDDDF